MLATDLVKYGLSSNNTDVWTASSYASNAPTLSWAGVLPRWLPQNRIKKDIRMTFLALNRPQSSVTTVFAGTLRSIAAAAARRAAYRQTVKELRSLSLHELDDIGIAPGDIRAIARASADLV